MQPVANGELSLAGTDSDALFKDLRSCLLPTLVSTLRVRRDVKLVQKRRKDMGSCEGSSSRAQPEPLKFPRKILESITVAKSPSHQQTPKESRDACQLK